jgi:hypothetical protein
LGASLLFEEVVSCITFDMEASSNLNPFFTEMPLLQNRVFNISPLFDALLSSSAPGRLQLDSFEVWPNRLQSSTTLLKEFTLDYDARQSLLIQDTTSMFLTQPPCAAMVVEVEGLEVEPDVCLSVVVRGNGGVTLGLIKEVLYKMLGGCRDDDSLLLSCWFEVCEEKEDGNTKLQTI